MKIKKPEFLITAEKRLKNIVGILRDKEIVGFTLTMKLHRDALSGPTTISIQGERSDDGGGSTRLPIDQNPEVLQSRETLKGKLASIDERVNEYIAKNAFDVDWNELKSSIDEALKSGLSMADLEYQSDVPFQAIAAHSYEAHFCAPTMATAYSKQGADALARNDLIHASHCVDRGLHWSSPAMFIPNPNDRFKERASAGGRSKDLHREPVRDKVAELLMTLAPEDGWEYTSAAAEAVANELIDRHSSFVEKCELKPENLPRTILRWVRAAPERFTHRIKSKI